MTPALALAAAIAIVPPGIWIIIGALVVAILGQLIPARHYQRGGRMLAAIAAAAILALAGLAMRWLFGRWVRWAARTLAPPADDEQHWREACHMLHPDLPGDDDDV